ncbi:uncharacterized protein LOC119833795 [Zerene cesonia]|uniref:uncharacterized protein LOC119833795 n=1 Tax=Zerene cesonia TaxID=33412 RepID=UPI0018E5252A|nr:uncharacterized protein LOC119833795 [Zerene cesonia]
MFKHGCEHTSDVHCERYNRLSQRLKGDRIMPRVKLVKKVVLSRNIGVSTSEQRKSCSTGIITHKQTINKQKKMTKSDCILDPTTSLTKLDCCKKCGDTDYIRKDSTSRHTNEKLSDLYSLQSLHRIINNNKASKHDFRNDKLKQYYRNENFQMSSESIPDIMYNTKKTSLETIKEQSEQMQPASRDSTLKLYTDSSVEEMGFFNPNDTDNLKNIKEFRSDNYFECHSVKSRIKHRIASDDKHKCVYRFYLNDRLFPVPFNTDFEENIRCMECNLPLQNKEDFSNINGMIQAKVKLNDKVQDTIVMLPVKEPLIIKERKKDANTRKELDSVYFGIVKLNLNGDSIFNKTQPDDSLALKYQKGYKKFSDDLKYDYNNCNNDDVIII